MKPLSFIILLMLSPFVLARPLPASTAETMPLSEVRAGMKGEWETIVSGIKTERYGFEVVGIVPNFIGPKRSVILALATDASQILSGPVAGMSGSPCYIDGKLVGAYAYGYTWPKEQTLIGITPISYMLEAFEKEEQRHELARYSQVRSSSQDASFQERLAAWGDLERIEALLEGKAKAKTPEAREAALTPLPTPLFTSGISMQAMEPFAKALRALGLEPMAAPVGSADHLDASAIAPGSALAGVLVDGDFRMAAVGSVTWREGDQFLAFGHPFFGTGDVEIPAAPAEILTVVQSIPRSFKLGNIGPIVGSIQQDRLSAISGELGLIPAMTELSCAVTASDGVTRSYSGKMFRDRSLTPFITAIGIFQSLLGTMENADEQTLTLAAEYTIEGHEPFRMTRTVTGTSAPAQLAIEQWLLASLLMNNPFSEADIPSISFNIEQKLGREQTTLEAVRQLSGQVDAGEPWRLGLTLGRYLEEAERQSISVPIPEGTANEELTVFIGDAYAADRLQRGRSNRDITSFEGLLDALRGSRSNEKAYVLLLRPAPGLRIDGQEMPALPPSARLLLDSPRQDGTSVSSQWQTIWEDAIEFPGVFTGSHFIKLKVR